MVAMEIPTYPFTVEDVPLSELQIDDAYQRPENKQWIVRTINRFNPLLIGTMICNRRDDGSIYLIDGQQRRAVLMDVGYDAVHTVMLEGLTQREEAAIFYRINRDRMKISPYYDFRARLVAGDRFAIELNRLVHSAGYSFGGATNNDDVIGAIRGTEHGYRMISEPSPTEGDALRTALLAIKRNWRGRNRCLDKLAIIGMTRFHAVFGPDLMSGTLDQVMEKLSPIQLLGIAADRTKRNEAGLPSGLAVAGVLFDEYNKLVGREDRLDAKKWRAAKVTYVTVNEEDEG